MVRQVVRSKPEVLPSEQLMIIIVIIDNAKK